MILALGCGRKPDELLRPSHDRERVFCDEQVLIQHLLGDGSAMIFEIDHCSIGVVVGGNVIDPSIVAR